MLDSNDNSNPDAAGPAIPANPELDGLAGLAAQADHVAMAADAPLDPAAIGQPAMATGPDYQHEAAATVDMIEAMIVGYAPAAASVWTPRAKGGIVGALAPVMEKYGFTLGAMPCELVLVIMAGPVLYKSAKIVGEQMKAERAALAAPAAPPAGAPAPAAGIATAAPAAAAGPQAAVHEQVKLYQP